MIFVTDRTEVPQTFYNISDLNRVESNVQTLSDLLNTAGYINSVDTKDTWSVTEFFNVEDDVRYIGNIDNLIDVFYTTAPQLPDSVRRMNYVGANNIEKNLESIYTLINNMIDNYKYAGTFESGEDIL